MLYDFSTMCLKRSSATVRIHGKKVRVDACLKTEIEDLNWAGYRTVSSCCGHGRYPKTILARITEKKIPIENGKKVKVVKNPEYGKIRVLMSYIIVPRRRNFYKRDKDGYYFIPEVLAKWDEKRLEEARKHGFMLVKNL